MREYFFSRRRSPAVIQLGATFIDRHISTFFVISSEIVFKNEPYIRIVRDEGLTKRMDDMLILSFAGQAQNKLERIQLADTFKLHPHRQTKALVYSNQAGTLIVEPALELVAKYGVSVSDGSMQ